MSLDPSLDGGRSPLRSPPSGVSERLDADATASVVLLGVAVGVQWMLAAMILWGRKGVDPALASRFSQRGLILLRPERDMAIYVAGCASILQLTHGLLRVWWDRIRRLDPADTGGILRVGIVAMVGAGIAATASFLMALDAARSQAAAGATGSAAALLFGPGALAGLIAGTCVRLGPGLLPKPRPGEGREGGGPVPIPDRGPARGGGGLARDGLAVLAMAVLLVAVLYVPSYRTFAGRIMDLDVAAFHHWDFFAMGPALGYRHGASLGTDVFSQYGVGWPTLVASAGLGYGTMIHLSVIYVIIHFLGLFLVARWFVGSTGWAAAATILTVNMTLFGAIPPGSTIWIYPSSTPLRSPMESWFFLATLPYLRSGHAGWAALMGVCAGLALIFVTDTGIDLVITMAIILGCRLMLADGSGMGWREPARRGFAAVLGPAVMVVTALRGLAIASRGTIVRLAFWRGWLEAMRDYGGGIAALPIATYPDRASLALFLLIVGTYLAVLGLLGAKLIQRRASRELVFAGSLAVYGLGRALYFVNRSHPMSLPQSSAPVWLILTWMAASASHRAGIPVRVWAPRVALVLALVALAANPAWRSHPSLARSILEGPPAEGLSLMPDVAGLSVASRLFVEEFHDVTREVEALGRGGRTVAVLETADTMFYLASNRRPWGRYSPLIPAILRHDQLERERLRLEDGGPDFIVERVITLTRGRVDPEYDDVLRAFRDVLDRRYARVGRVGRFVIWRREPVGRLPSGPRVDRRWAGQTAP